MSNLTVNATAADKRVAASARLLVMPRLRVSEGAVWLQGDARIAARLGDSFQQVPVTKSVRIPSTQYPTTHVPGSHAWRPPA